ncbi:DUF5928 domain-containing protein [Poseidonocella sedimentorum]|uniref:Peptide O-xylosyltransferase n=1 Tax=Poseidonocella sedimentorum TaxID=871652 RepID=A0A1I6D756_9RHOB|nr:DUF5928 domain-containing protein [Poseidonocella sedimentorum]SFR01304.1 Core-2/I-Branching enzyme [Poseidonocella sedimentorum]
MARIAYILLCHKEPEHVIDQARRLVAAGDFVSIHYDARAPKAEFAALKAALAEEPNVCFARRRVKCGWGEWTLVRATLSALEAAVGAFPRATHFYMLSGDCMPIKSAAYAHEFLDERERDFIESVDFHTSGWIKTGIKEERLVYRHFFNERAQKRLFYASLGLQERFGLKRAIPDGLRIMIGSQWWCLRRRTVERLLEFLRQRRDIIRFFSTTWIPDETFFQTLVRHLVPEEEIEPSTLTFLMFSDYGMPIQFYNDHYDLLLAQDALFARKISPEAEDLRARLGALYADPRTRFDISGEGKRLHGFLTSRGRIGRRFASRFWEKESTLGRERELMIVVCKKWHVAKRLLERVRQVTNMPTVNYLFNEESTPLPDMGGIERQMDKRTRHCRALMRMLFDHFETDRLAICIDPGSLDLLHDFFSDRARTRLLEIECSFSDAYLAGHARRIGLAGATTPEAALARLLPSLRQDILYETDRIRDAEFPDHSIMRQTQTVAENAAALAEFLAVSPQTAHEIAATDYLFAD